MSSGRFKGGVKDICPPPPQKKIKGKRRERKENKQ